MGLGKLIRLMRLGTFLLFVHKTHKYYVFHSSKDTLRTVHSSTESYAVRARFIGREEREFVITPRTYKYCTGVDIKFSTISTIVFHRVVEKV